ncbi:hypothetical protein ccbrp13_37610 [Ktedonobacteria bacterium brp13]|nr:hypothetical protein ccbrp13_37610 [Ktedonobacteria bacterium brp13]
MPTRIEKLVRKKSEALEVKNKGPFKLQDPARNNAMSNDDPVSQSKNFLE